MEQLPKRFTRGDAKKQADIEDLNEESEAEKDVMSRLSENEMEVIRVEEKRRKETTKAIMGVASKNLDLAATGEVNKDLLTLAFLDNTYLATHFS
ncbi:hypothetical protein Tco_1013528 [Tanacetum coccineum]